MRCAVALLAFVAGAYAQDPSPSVMASPTPAPPFDVSVDVTVCGYLNYTTCPTNGYIALDEVFQLNGTASQISFGLATLNNDLAGYAFDRSLSSTPSCDAPSTTNAESFPMSLCNANRGFSEKGKCGVATGFSCGANSKCLTTGTSYNGDNNGVVKGTTVLTTPKTNCSFSIVAIYSGISNGPASCKTPLTVSTVCKAGSGSGGGSSASALQIGVIPAVGALVLLLANLVL